MSTLRSGNSPEGSQIQTAINNPNASTAENEPEVSYEKLRSHGSQVNTQSDHTRTQCENQHVFPGKQITLS